MTDEEDDHPPDSYQECCSAVCTRCGALNSFPGFTTVEAFICSECGEPVIVEPSTQ
jgi:uncharacterized protein (DUF983 family)